MNDVKDDQKQPLLPATTVSIRSAIIDVVVSALPFALSDAILMAIGFITSKYLEEEYGRDGLAAATLAGSLVNLTYGFTISSLYQVSTNAGEAYGERQPVKVGIIYRQGMVFAVLLSLPGIGVLLLGDLIFRELNQPEEVIEIAKQYLEGFAIGYLPALGYVVDQQLALVLDKPYSLVIAALGDTVLTALFGYLFTFGKFGFPRWGAFGLGLGNSLANLATFIGFTLYFRRREFGQYILFAGIWSKQELIRLITTGVKIGLQYTAEFVSLLGLSIMVGLQEDGVNALAAEQVSLLYLNVLSIPTQISIAQAASVLVAKAFGENRFDDSRRYGNIAVLLSAGTSVICLIIVLGFNNYLIKPFVDDPDNHALVSTASDLLILNTATQILDAFRIVTGGGLRGYDDVNSATVWGIIGNTVIALPLAYVLGFYTDLNTLGMFAARTIGIGIATTAMSYRWWNKSSHAESLKSKPTATIEEMKSTPTPPPKKGYASWFCDCASSLYNRLRGSPPAQPNVSAPSITSTVRQTGPA